MKVYIIKACAQSKFKEYKKYLAAPPQSIFSMAACTPKGVDIQMTDETVDMPVKYKTKADVVVIFFSTPDAYRAYEIAEKFIKLGKQVILSGLHVKFNQEEALKHCDSIIVGECETIWDEVLQDIYDNNLRKRYCGEPVDDMSVLKPYPTNMIPIEKYNHVWSVLVSRGCNNHCSYCLVNKFFDGIRYRPIDDIIAEIINSKAYFVELHADHLTANREYAKELFERLIPLNIKWTAETTADFADDEELVELAAKSGLCYLLLGLETPDMASLKQMNKGFAEITKTKSRIKTLHKYNIMVDSAMMFGLEHHTKSIFDETIQFVKDIGLDIVHAVVPIPFPGTRFYRELWASDRILTKDWSKYDGRHLVFEHKHLSPKDIEEGIKYFEDSVYSLRTAYKYYKFVYNLGMHDFGKGRKNEY